MARMVIYHEMPSSRVYTSDPGCLPSRHIHPSLTPASPFDRGVSCKMRPLLLITTLLGWVSSVVSIDDGLTDLVSWDSYSLSVNGSRVFINSAEFHYQRLPVPELWLDIFHRLKANGFNTVSIYFFWSYHSASKGVFDFESPGKDLQQLFDYAKEAGLWVVARPG